MRSKIHELMTKACSSLISVQSSSKGFLFNVLRLSYVFASKLLSTQSNHWPSEPMISKPSDSPLIDAETLTVKSASLSTCCLIIPLFKSRWFVTDECMKITSLDLSRLFFQNQVLISFNKAADSRPLPIKVKWNSDYKVVFKKASTSAPYELIAK